MIKKFLYSVLLIFFIAGAQPAHAQSQFETEKEYREYLFGVIELLQQQIAILSDSQREFTSMPKKQTEDFSSFLIEDERNLEARYFLDDSSQVQGISNQNHRELFSRFFTLVPDEFDNYFKELIIFDERKYEFEGFVETIPPYRSDTWRLGINESMFDFRITSSATTELFVHEFAHIVSYDEIIGVPEPGTSRCHEYYEELGCPPGNSYLVAFADIFWPDSILDDFIEEGDSLWSDRELQNDFVTDYAATAPGEDFAESFTDFILEDYPNGSKLKDEKVRFFWEFDALLELRKEIKNQI